MQKVRIPLLIVIFGSALFVLGKTTLAPVTSNRTATFFIFPTAVPLSQWQSSSSRPLADSIAKGPKSLSGNHYQYIQKGLTLDIRPLSN